MESVNLSCDWLTSYRSMRAYSFPQLFEFQTEGTFRKIVSMPAIHFEFFVTSLFVTSPKTRVFGLQFGEKRIIVGLLLLKIYHSVMDGWMRRILGLPITSLTRCKTELISLVGASPKFRRIPILTEQRNSGRLCLQHQLIINIPASSCIAIYSIYVEFLCLPVCLFFVNICSDICILFSYLANSNFSKDTFGLLNSALYKIINFSKSDVAEITVKVNFRVASEHLNFQLHVRRSYRSA